MAQEATSMVPGELLRRACGKAKRVLDLCAAPGSKSTQLGAWVPFLVANEVDEARPLGTRTRASEWFS